VNDLVHSRRLVLRNCTRHVGGGDRLRLTDPVITLGFQRAPDAAALRRRQAGLGA